MSRHRKRPSKQRRLAQQRRPSAEIKPEVIPVREASFMYNYKVLFSGLALEAGQRFAGLGGKIPEPLDVFNHAGNMWIGGFVALATTQGVIAANQRSGRSPDHYSVKENDFRSTRRIIVGASVGVTALVNCITETKWGVSHLPVAEALNGTTPDVLDTAYSTAFAGLLTTLGWRQSARAIPPTQPNER